MVRAKMMLTAITAHSWGGKSLEFSCEYDPSIPEDVRFQKATPSGNVKICIDNPTAVSQFELSKSYYVDFTPAK